MRSWSRREALFDVAVAVAPAAELLDDPRQQPGGGVVERHAQRLRSASLHLRVRGVLALEPRHRREVGLLLVGERWRSLGWARDRHVEVQRGAVPGIERGDPGRDLRAPVATLRAVALVSQARHQLDERLRDPADVPSRACAAVRRSA